MFRTLRLFTVQIPHSEVYQRTELPPIFVPQLVKMFDVNSVTPVIWNVRLRCSDGWLEARIRKVLRPAISTQVFLVFLGPRRKCWDGSHFSSKLPLHASHVALPN